MKFDAFEVEYYDEFDDNVDRFVVKKKFRKLPEQIEEMVAEFEKGNLDGNLLSRRENPVKYELYKLRMRNKDTNAGESNGYRVIYIALTEAKIVVLLTIYYKKEVDSLSDAYVDALIKGYFLEKMEEE